MYSKKVLGYLKKKRISVGDTVELQTTYDKVKGLLLDRPNYLDEDTLIIKLDNGYNTGINLRNIDSVNVVKKAEVEIKSNKGSAQNVKKPFISILHTGGTIASKVDYKTGGVISRFEPSELINMFPELKNYGNIHSLFMGNMFSDDMRFAHYAKMADYVTKEIENGTSGVIITHGTDTMAYTSAALSFIFDNIPIPVLLVGAQRSSDRGSSDAGMNLVCAAKFIKNSDFRGVAICMHGSSSDDYCNIMRGVNVRKLHSSRRDAFKPVNGNIIAKVDYLGDDITFISDYQRRSGKAGIFRVNPKMEDKVAVLKVHTNMHAEQFAFYRTAKYKGLIIEGTGLGHAPINEIDIPTKEHTRIRNELEKLVESGCTVVMCTQTIFGSVNMNVYSPGREMQHFGIIPGYSMTTETAFVKLAWLLANDKKNIRKLMIENLRGEIVKRLIV
ncbi:Glutamyl-tRNA(Gln) amidotransferase subunit D [Candidatus Tiddalikarchaeum anstoanum]|nr:Glutamyl-tRNA(Gln) amidotransferase subunit D [Candidatus Tiddalikarchaeum anstoanum]